MRGATYIPYYIPLRGTKFQSTHPMRGATSGPPLPALPARNFNPRTPCGVRQLVIRCREFEGGISIHAPHAGCDTARKSSSAPTKHFNPRTPCGVRPEIHFLHGSSLRDFNPRTPCGVRPRGPRALRGLRGISIHAPHAGCDFPCSVILNVSFAFQSTHPMRGATFHFHRSFLFCLISIHAPHAGCDERASSLPSYPFIFQSTHPMRGATTTWFYSL